MTLIKVLILVVVIKLSIIETGYNGNCHEVMRSKVGAVDWRSRGETVDEESNRRSWLLPRHALTKSKRTHINWSETISIKCIWQILFSRKIKTRLENARFLLHYPVRDAIDCRRIYRIFEERKYCISRRRCRHWIACRSRWFHQP